jgi:hypothetical protein
VQRELATAVGQLLAFGLQPKTYPGSDVEYHALVMRYRSDAAFQAAVDGVADGLGLVVVDASGLGFLLGARADSVFAYKLADFRRERGTSGGVDDRLLHGLALAAIAAYFYPQPQDLAQERHRPASVRQVEAFLRAFCQEHAPVDRAVQDAEPSEFEQARDLYVRQKEAVRTADGRRAQRGTVSVVGRVFDLLAEHGLVRRVREDTTDPTYQPLERFRVQAGAFAGQEAFEALRQARLRLDAEAARSEATR